MITCEGRQLQFKAAKMRKSKGQWRNSLVLMLQIISRYVKNVGLNQQQQTVQRFAVFPHPEITMDTFQVVKIISSIILFNDLKFRR